MSFNKCKIFRNNYTLVFFTFGLYDDYTVRYSAIQSTFDFSSYCQTLVTIGWTQNILGCHDNL